MSDQDALEEGHLPHAKHVQLGVALSVEGEDPTFASEEDYDAIWAEALTVQEYKEALEALAAADPDGP